MITYAKLSYLTEKSKSPFFSLTNARFEAKIAFVYIIHAQKCPRCKAEQGFKRGILL